MVKIVEILSTLLVISIGNKINDYYKPDLIELHLSNGNIHYIKIDKANSYSCPKSCKAIHYHNTLIVEDYHDKENYSLAYNANQLTLNDFEVLSAFEIIEIKKTKKNKSTKTERNQLDIQSFFYKYY